jgi:hypothetical protein
MSIIKTLMLLLFLSVNMVELHAQSIVNADSAYYLLDTAKTPASDRLWNTYTEGRVKFYELKVYSACAPLLLDRPTFAYSSNRQTPKPLSKIEFDLIKKVSLFNLLLRLKQFADEDSKIDRRLKKMFILYIIEPSSTGYIITKTQLNGSGPKTVTD